MLVADTSALVSLGSVDTLEIVFAEFDVHTTETVMAELADTAEFDYYHGVGAQAVLDRDDGLTVHDVGDPEIVSSRIDDGESGCVALVNHIDAAFLLTDDLGALPELEVLVDTRVAISPIVLRALVDRGVMDANEALDHVKRPAETRGWLGAPIYRRAVQLFEDG